MESALHFLDFFNSYSQYDSTTTTTTTTTTIPYDSKEESLVENSISYEKVFLNGLQSHHDQTFLENRKVNDLFGALVSRKIHIDSQLAHNYQLFSLSLPPLDITDSNFQPEIFKKSRQVAYNNIPGYSSNVYNTNEEEDVMEEIPRNHHMAQQYLSMIPTKYFHRIYYPKSHLLKYHVANIPIVMSCSLYAMRGIESELFNIENPQFLFLAIQGVTIGASCKALSTYYNQLILRKLLNQCLFGLSEASCNQVYSTLKQIIDELMVAFDSSLDFMKDNLNVIHHLDYLDNITRHHRNMLQSISIILFPSYVIKQFQLGLFHDINDYLYNHKLWKSHFQTLEPVNVISKIVTEINILSKGLIGPFTDLTSTIINEATIEYLTLGIIFSHISEPFFSSVNSLLFQLNTTNKEDNLKLYEIDDYISVSLTSIKNACDQQDDYMLIVVMIMNWIKSRLSIFPLNSKLRAECCMSEVKLKFPFSLCDIKEATLYLLSIQEHCKDLLTSIEDIFIHWKEDLSILDSNKMKDWRDKRIQANVVTKKSYSIAGFHDVPKANLNNQPKEMSKKKRELLKRIEEQEQEDDKQRDRLKSIIGLEVAETSQELIKEAKEQILTKYAHLESDIDKRIYWTQWKTKSEKETNARRDKLSKLYQEEMSTWSEASNSPVKDQNFEYLDEKDDDVAFEEMKYSEVSSLSDVSYDMTLNIQRVHQPPGGVSTIDLSHELIEPIVESLNMNSDYSGIRVLQAPGGDSRIVLGVDHLSNELVNINSKVTNIEENSNNQDSNVNDIIDTIEDTCNKPEIEMNSITKQSDDISNVEPLEVEESELKMISKSIWLNEIDILLQPDVKYIEEESHYREQIFSSLHQYLLRLGHSHGLCDDTSFIESIDQRMKKSLLPLILQQAQVIDFICLKYTLENCHILESLRDIEDWYLLSNKGDKLLQVIQDYFNSYEEDSSQWNIWSADRINDMLRRDRVTSMISLPLYKTSSRNSTSNSITSTSTSISTSTSTLSHDLFSIKGLDDLSIWYMPIYSHSQVILMKIFQSIFTLETITYFTYLNQRIFELYHLKYLFRRCWISLRRNEKLQVLNRQERKSLSLICLRVQWMIEQVTKFITHQLVICKEEFEMKVIISIRKNGFQGFVTSIQQYAKQLAITTFSHLDDNLMKRWEWEEEISLKLMTSSSLDFNEDLPIVDQFHILLSLCRSVIKIMTQSIVNMESRFDDIFSKILRLMTCINQQREVIISKAKSEISKASINTLNYEILLEYLQIN